MGTATARWPGRAAALLVVGAGAAAWAAVRLPGRDQFNDAIGGLGQLPWAAVGVTSLLVLLSAVHFVSAGVALRSVTGGRVRLSAVTLAQLAAAATNRVVPNGVGGAGVNLRFLVRNGIPAAAAASTLGALAVTGGATDAGYAAALSAVGPAVGVPGAAAELSRLSSAGTAATARVVWVLPAAVGLLLAWFLVRHRKDLKATVGSAVRHATTAAWQLVRAPGSVAAAATASTATTAALTVAFVAAVHTWGASAHPLGAGALAAVYLVAAAAGGAAPLPPVFGVTEGALVAGLLLGGYSPASAIVSVAVFRAVTYWVPLPVGVWAARRLRRAALL